MKKIFIILILFFSFYSYSYGYTGQLIETNNQTFVELDLSNYDYELQTYNSGTTILTDYTKEFSDLSKLLFQIKIILLVNGIFLLLFVFYTIINDLLGKR